MGLQAGQLRQEFVIEQRSTGADTVGQPVDTWTTFATVRGRFDHGGDGESYQADRRVAEQRGVMVIRYRAGVTPRMRVRWRGQVWEIEGVGEKRHLEELHLTVHCLEQVSGSVS